MPSRAVSPPGSGFLGSFSSRVAALYANVATITAFPIMSVA